MQGDMAKLPVGMSKLKPHSDRKLVYLRSECVFFACSFYFIINKMREYGGSFIKGFHLHSITQVKDN